MLGRVWRRVGWVAFGLALVSALGSCRRPRRTQNWGVLLGAEASPVTATGGGMSSEEVVGGVHVMAQGAERDDDWLSYRGRIDLGFGGNAEAGWAGHAGLDAQFGFAFFDGTEHLFARLGLLGLVEEDPWTSLYLLEVPTLFFGYEHHGEDADDPWHIDVGPRVSLASAMRVRAPQGHEHDVVAGPGTGAAALVMTNFVSAEITYMHYFADGDVDLLRASLCFGALIGVCLDTRHLFAPFGGGWEHTGYWGIRFGFGVITGIE